LDNGAQPFKVVLRYENGKVNATFSDNTSVPDKWGESFARQDKFNGFSKRIPDVDEIWLGCGSYDDVYDKSNKWYIGNTALLVKGQQCISLASTINQFKLSKGEKITNYISTVGNNAVPYGWIETTKGYYALASFNCATGFLPTEEFDLWKAHPDPYNTQRCMQMRKKRVQKIKTLKMLVPRAY